MSFLAFSCSLFLNLHGLFHWSSHIKLPGKQADDRQEFLSILQHVSATYPYSLQSVLVNCNELQPGQYRNCSLVDTNSLEVLALCWAPGAKVYASFADGHIAVVDAEQGSAQLLHAKCEACEKVSHSGEDGAIVPDHCGRALTCGRYGLYLAGEVSKLPGVMCLCTVIS